MVGSTATSSPLAMSKIAALPKKSHGFSLIELMIVVAIIAVVAAIAYPNYMNSIRATKRTDAMTRLQNAVVRIEADKMRTGKYDSVVANKYLKGESHGDTSKYYVFSYRATTKPQGFKIVASPKKNGLMQNDGDLSIDHKGIKCHAGKCGTGAEWRQ